MEKSDPRYLELEKELFEAKKTIKKLTEINASFDLFLNHMDDFIWLMNKDLELTYVSPSVKQTLGYTEKEFLLKPLLGFGTPETKAKIKQAYHDRINGLADDSQKQWVTQVYHKNGVLVWIETLTNPIISDKGEFDGVLCVSRDITQKISIERKIQESEANLIAQIENTADSIWSIDNTYCVKTLNTNFKNYFELAFGIELFSGNCIIDLLPEPYRKLWKERYDKALTGEAFVVTDHFEFEGVPQYVEINFSPILFNKKTIGVSCFSKDISLQKLSEENIIETNANLLSVIEHTDARIWSIDLNYNIITINTNFRKDYQTAFGITLRKGSYSLENLPEGLFIQWKDRYDKVLKGEHLSLTDQFEISGVPQYVDISMNPIFVNDKVIGGTCYSRDVTQQKLSELALQESEERYKSLVANMPSVSYRCLTDKNWTMKFMSNEISYLSGYAPEDFINNENRSFRSLIHPEDIEFVDLVILEKLAVKDSFSVEYRIFHKSGEIRWVQDRGRGNYNENNDLESFDGVIADISLRKKNELELQESEHKFRVLSDASFDMLLLKTQAEILKYTADTLHKTLNRSIIIAFSLLEDQESSKIIHIAGIEPNTLEQISGIAGLDFFDKKYPIHKHIKEKIYAGKVFEFEDGFIGFSSIQLQKQTSEKIAKILKINKIYCVGVIKDEEQFGALYIIPQERQIEDNIPFIESLSNLSSILVQRAQLIDDLNNSEEKARTIFENTSSAISIQTDTNILLVNNAWEKIMGYSAEESKSLHPLDIVHKQDWQQYSILTKKRILGEEVPITNLVHIIDKQMNEKWVDFSTTLIDYEGQKATLNVGTDITERKKAELELNKFTTGIMNSPSSIVITDIDGTIEYVNPFFCDFTEYSAEEVIGKNPKVLSSGKNAKELYEDLWCTILKGEVWNGEFHNRKKNGQFYWENARIAPIFDDNGIITNFIAIKEDITEQKRTWELIEQSEKDLRDINAKKDKFFSIIAHDLRSPFSGLAGLIEILKSSIKELSDEKIDYYLELMQESTQNIFKLLENLLSWAKSQTGKIEFDPLPLNLSQVVNNTISIIDISAKNKDISLKSTIDSNVTVYADENMLDTVLRNLISNALKYTHKNGKVSVFHEIHKYDKKSFSVIGIRDNGVGIPLGRQGKIFNIEDNYSTNGTEKEKGTGLGLILCKEFVERHEGKIWCESAENKGSTFFFSLPIVNR